MDPLATTPQDEEDTESLLPKIDTVVSLNGRDGEIDISVEEHPRPVDEGHDEGQGGFLQGIRRFQQKGGGRRSNWEVEDEEDDVEEGQHQGQFDYDEMEVEDVEAFGVDQRSASAYHHHHQEEEQVNNTNPRGGINGGGSSGSALAFRCATIGCAFRASNLEKIEVHEKHAHDPSHTQLCPQCPCRFKIKVNLTRHLQKAHQYYGEESSGRNKNQIPKILRIMMENKGTKKYYKCSACEYKNRSLHPVEVHAHTAHVPNGNHSCPYCACRYAKKNQLSQHISMMHERKGQFSHQNQLRPSSSTSASSVSVIRYSTGGTSGGTPTPTPPTPETPESPAPSSFYRPRPAISIPPIPSLMARARAGGNARFIKDTGRYPFTMKTVLETGEEISYKKVLINGQVRHACKLCPATLRKKQGMINHIQKAHVPSGTFVCPQCPCRFDSMIDFNRHTSNHVSINSPHRDPHVVNGGSGSGPAGRIPIPTTNTNSTNPLGHDFPSDFSPLPPVLSPPVLSPSPAMRNPFHSAFTDNSPQDEIFSMIRTTTDNGKLQFCCVSCGHINDHVNKIQDHVRANHGSAAQYPCSIGNCKAKFMSDLGLKIHLAKVHLQATEDVQILDDQSDNDISVLMFEGTTLYRCKKCGETSNFEEQMRSHSEKTHIFACSSCPLQFVNARSHRIHRCVVHSSASESEDNSRSKSASKFYPNITNVPRKTQNSPPEDIRPPNLLRQEEQREESPMEQEEQRTGTVGPIPPVTAAVPPPPLVPRPTRPALTPKRGIMVDGGWVTYSAEINSRGRYEYFCDSCKYQSDVSGIKEHVRVAHNPNNNFLCKLCTCRYSNKSRLSFHLMKRHDISPPPPDKRNRKKPTTPTPTKTKLPQKYNKANVPSPSVKLPPQALQTPQTLPPPPPLKERPITVDQVQIEKNNLEVNPPALEMAEGRGALEKTPKKNMTVAQYASSPQSNSYLINSRTPEGNVLYLCKLCDGKFRHLWHAKSHIAHHDPRKKFVCNICSWRYQNIKLLARHTQQKHPGTKQKYPGATSTKVKKRKPSFHLSISLNCQVEGCLFETSPENQGGMEEHMAVVHKRDNFNPQQEEEIEESLEEETLDEMDSEYEVSKRKRTPSKQPPSSASYNCPHCGARCRTRPGMHSHLIANHSKGNTFECPHCVCKLRTEEGLRNHIYKHHRSKRDKASFKTNTSLFIRLKKGKIHKKKRQAQVQINKEPQQVQQEQEQDQLLHQEVSTPVANTSISSAQNQSQKVICPVCCAAFNNSSSVTWHIMKAHPEHKDNLDEMIATSPGAPGTSAPESSQAEVEDSPSHAQPPEKNTADTDDATRTTRSSLTKAARKYAEITGPMDLMDEEEDYEDDNDENVNDLDYQVSQRRNSVKRRDGAGAGGVGRIVLEDKYPRDPITRNFLCNQCHFTSTRNALVIQHVARAHVPGGVKCLDCSCTFKNANSRDMHAKFVHRTLKPNTPTKPKPKHKRKKLGGRKGRRHRNRTHTPVIIRFSSASGDDLNVPRPSSFSLSEDENREVRLGSASTSRSQSNDSGTGEGIPTTTNSSSTNAAGPARLFTCSMCPFTTLSGVHLKNHKLNSHALGGYPCKYCTYQFRNPVLLTNHMKSRHQKQVEEEGIELPDADADETETDGEQPVKEEEEHRPMKERNDVKPELFSCDMCNFTTELRFKLKRHRVEHTLNNTNKVNETASASAPVNGPQSSESSTATVLITRKRKSSETEIRDSDSGVEQGNENSESESPQKRPRVANNDEESGNNDNHNQQPDGNIEKETDEQIVPSPDENVNLTHEEEQTLNETEKIRVVTLNLGRTAGHKEFMKWQCYRCSREFEANMRLVNHIERCSSSSSRFNCTICGTDDKDVIFPSLFLLKKHLWKKHVSSAEKRKNYEESQQEKERQQQDCPYKCRLCKKGFQDKKSFVFHLSRTHIFKCKRCQFVAPTKTALKAHEFSMHNRGSIPIIPLVDAEEDIEIIYEGRGEGESPTKSTPKKKIRESLITNGNGSAETEKEDEPTFESLICEKCGYVSQNLDDARKHFQALNEIGSKMCSICGEVSNSQCEAAIHEKSHEQEEMETEGDNDNETENSTFSNLETEEAEPMPMVILPPPDFQIEVEFSPEGGEVSSHTIGDPHASDGDTVFHMPAI